MKAVITTFASEDDAARVIRALIEEKLAACGTMLPGARSIYVWQGKVEDSMEVLAVLKTTRPAELASRLAELHPYETPEILVFSPENVSGAYAKWVAESCRKG